MRFQLLFRGPQLCRVRFLFGRQLVAKLLNLMDQTLRLFVESVIQCFDLKSQAVFGVVHLDLLVLYLLQQSCAVTY